VVLAQRSTTQAFCWGTTLTDRVMKMTAMTNMTIAISMGVFPGFGCGNAIQSVIRVDQQAVAHQFGHPVRAGGWGTHPAGGWRSSWRRGI
jgi:hypothetical protein